MTMKSILYIANVRMPSEKAHGVQIAKTCEALTRAGAKVDLIVPKRKTPITEDVASYYDLKERFPITKLPVFDTVSWGMPGFLIESFSFAFAVARYIRSRSGIVYGRDEIILGIISFLTTREIVWESHTGAWNFFAKRVAHRAKCIVVISGGLRDFYIMRGILAERIVVAHDGIDLQAFEHPESKIESRKRLGLSETGLVAMYIGGFGGWKGTDTLFEASDFLPDAMRMTVIGGTPEEIAQVQKKYPRIIFLGSRPYRELADNQAAADVLVLPTTGKSVIGARFTSPLKLFAYMASGRPIVASDIPSAREVLPDNAAYWFKPDDAKDLAAIIEKAASDLHASERARIAKGEVARYTWDARAASILGHL